MSVQNINAQSLKPEVSFKSNHKNEEQPVENKKHSAAKTVAWTTAGVAAVAALTFAGIKLAKSGKLNEIKNTIKNIVKKPEAKALYRGTKSQSFESPKAMADEIVADFKAMKNRVRGHNFVQYRYNKMDWSKVIPRSEAIK